MASDVKHHNPPYVSFATLKSFVGVLHETVLPEHIDRSMMDNMSGGSQSHVLLSMRFLGLLDENQNDRVTDDLRELVGAFGTDQFAPILRRVLETAYADVTDGFDISSVTEKQVKDAFREKGGVDGSVLDRCVRFFVKAMADAGATVSPHLGKRKPRTTRKNGSAPQARRTAKNATQPPKGAPPQTEHTKLQTLPVFLGSNRAGNITFPADANEQDVEKYAAAVEYMRQLVGAQ